MVLAHSKGSEQAMCYVPPKTSLHILHRVTCIYTHTCKHHYYVETLVSSSSSARKLMSRCSMP